MDDLQFPVFPEPAGSSDLTSIFPVFPVITPPKKVVAKQQKAASLEDLKDDNPTSV